jgi:hypothetical protein
VDNDEGKSRRCQRARSAVSISSYIGGLYKKDGGKCVMVRQAHHRW